MPRDIFSVQTLRDPSPVEVCQGNCHSSSVVIVHLSQFSITRFACALLQDRTQMHIHRPTRFRDPHYAWNLQQLVLQVGVPTSQEHRGWRIGMCLPLATTNKSVLAAVAIR